MFSVKNQEQFLQKIQNESLNKFCEQIHGKCSMKFMQVFLKKYFVYFSQESLDSERICGERFIDGIRERCLDGFFEPVLQIFRNMFFKSFLISSPNKLPEKFVN